MAARLLSDADTMSALTLRLEVPFESEQHAQIAYNSLRVDREPSRATTRRQLSVAADRLVAHLEAPDARSLRTAANALLDLVVLVCRTLERFGAERHAAV
ncbi:EKC/KEOPS complex subunit LAGE3 [Amphibalanus amphitrite]|uniref:L antigen family member 3 n=1 Tax=Amphibalanus amphitrite TaxID=1232801 RepID=A0A6A4V957_AMPAM|nr:EKC/KEOPS complex subunit LAGE3 [Amphibalanus amphitrite]